MKKKLLSFLLAACLALSLLPTAAFAAKSAADFTDVETTDWFYRYVNEGVQKGYFTGMPGNKFAPQDKTTRAQIVVILARYAGATTDNSRSVFADVPEGAWYTGAVTWAKENGLVNGVGGNKFAPSVAITRQELATMISNFVSWYEKANNVKHVKTGTAKEFADADAISTWAKDAIEQCQIYGLFVGDQNGNFRPKSDLTRAEAAAVFCRLSWEKDSGNGGGGGGGTSTPTPPTPTTSYSYTITYKNGADTLTTQTVSGTTRVLNFTAYERTNVTALPADSTDKVFVSWADADGMAYEPGETYQISGPLTLSAQWIDTSDYIALAVRTTMENINEQNIFGTITVNGSSVKLDPLAYSGVEQSGARPQTVSGSVSASSDLANAIIEQACNVAIQLLEVDPSGAPSQGEVEGVVQDVVKALEDALDIDIMKDDGIREIAKKIYEGVKKQTSPIFTEAFKNYNNGYCVSKMKLSVGDAKATVNFTTSQATLDLAGTTRRQVVKDMAVAIAKALYADLKTNTAYTDKLNLSAKVNVDFTRASGVPQGSPTAYPTSYPVTVKLALDAGGLAQVKYDAGKLTANGQPGAVVIRAHASELEAEYNEDAKKVISKAIVKMESSLNGTLGSLVEGSGTLSNIAKAVEKLGVDNVQQGGGEEYVKGKLNTWLTTNLGNGLDSRLVNGNLDNSLIEQLVEDVSVKASDAVSQKLGDKVTELKTGAGAPTAIDAAITAMLGDDFVPVKTDGIVGGGEYGIEELAETIQKTFSSSGTSGSSFSLDLDELKDLNDDLKLYIYSVITDRLKTEYKATAKNYTAQNSSKLATGVSQLINKQLEEKGINDLLDTMEQVSTLKGLSSLTLGNIKSLVEKEDIKDVVGNLGLTDRLKRYINRIPADRLPAGATVTFHINSKAYTLSKEDLTKFKTDANTSLATALANLATGERANLKLNDFDTNDGVQVDVKYNTRVFTFYLWIEGLN